MKSLLKRIAGADRPKIIAVIGLTRKDVEYASAHARTAGETLPIRAWCAEDTTASEMRRELRACWPALILVPWTGDRIHEAFKLLPFTIPPFRVVVYNENGDFFAARPGALAIHIWRRMLATARSGAHRTRDLTWGASRHSYSLGYRTAERIRDLIVLGWSFLYRAFETTRDVLWLGFCCLRLGYSYLYRFGEFLIAVFWLVIAALERGVEGVLALLARLARNTPERARLMYRGRQPGAPTGQPLPLGPPPNADYDEVVVRGRVWMRRKVRKTDAAFVVFRREGEKAPTEPLIRLAIERNAFAVARQLAWTGWRERVTHKHPFRRLLPGEVARVEMPFSSLIVVRRDAIALLGVPRAWTFGAALMLLFHKAAAAGWPSLVAGHSDPITQEPAMPLEDFEFVLRSEGRHQSPLARGNVVSSPSHALPFRGLPRVLVVSPYLPFPLAHGGAVRIYNICRSLADRIDFVLVCFREVEETVRYPELQAVFREVYTVDIDEKNADASVPKQVADYRNTAMAALIRQLSASVDLVQLEYTQMAEYRASAEGRPTILVEHDITFTLYQQLGHDYNVWERFESEALRGVDMVWTMSERDRALAIAHGAARQATVAIPNGVDLRRFQPVPRQTPGRTVLLVGSFRHLPNLLAFEALRQTIMPAVWRQFPECRLNVIAGPDHEKWARLADKAHLLTADPRITIQGFVEDVRPAYRECDVVAIPLPVSAGTNIKLMEAMACGRAIVSTPVGCQGLDLEDGLDLLVSGVGPAFAEALCRLLANDSEREQIAAHARRIAEGRFNWDIIARDALACYERLEKPCNLREETSVA